VLFGFLHYEPVLERADIVASVEQFAVGNKKRRFEGVEAESWQIGRFKRTRAC
jgi:hypothetical protein